MKSSVLKKKSEKVPTSGSEILPPTQKYIYIKLHKRLFWRKFIASTCLPVSLFRYLVTVRPALENALSEGADDAGIISSFCASL